MKYLKHRHSNNTEAQSTQNQEAEVSHIEANFKNIDWAISKKQQLFHRAL